MLIGGEGSDTFKWQQGDLDDGSVDKILDFTLKGQDESSKGDILDISELLSGRPEMNGQDLITGGYLNFTDIKHEDGTTTFTIKVDTNGGGDSYVDLAQVTMTGFELTGANPAGQAQEILEQLVQNKQITF
ncbi:MAG: type I secretion C-terminal target domain-containing protein [Oxalobacter formigenes]|nr:type I secretion C-terminal target domain-containing protein [Oxalobacter formigenes]